MRHESRHIDQTAGETAAEQAVIGERDCVYPRNLADAICEVAPQLTKARSNIRRACGSHAYGDHVIAIDADVTMQQLLHTAHEQATAGSSDSTAIAARRRGEEYLLQRRLLRRQSTGDVVNPSWLQFSFPTRWHYDVLRALDYFRQTAEPPDRRLDEAIELVRSRQQPDGTWLLENTHPGAVHFLLEEGDGRPSRWNTLRALRVLRWAERQAN